MKACDPQGPVMVQVAKLYHTTDAQSFRAFGRVMSGTVRKGMEIKVLGEGYSPEDEEDMLKATIDDIWISESRWAVSSRSVAATHFGAGISFLRTKFLQGTWYCWVVWTLRSPRLPH